MDRPVRPGTKAIEDFFRLATPVGAIIAFLIGVYHYRDAKAEEFKKEFWEKRYAVYEELSELTSRIANQSDTTSIDSLSEAFWTMYWGKVVLVEDKNVYEAIRDFGRTLDHVKLPDSTYMLREKSINVSNACRQSLNNTWQPIPLHVVRTLDK
jgi:hypothetical protein